MAENGEFTYVDRSLVCFFVLANEGLRFSQRQVKKPLRLLKYVMLVTKEG